jgi:hypothetical protein
MLSPAPARAQGAGQDTVRLVWTAPGDDGRSGTATAYELRYSTAQITLSNWSSATLAAGVPAPLPAGTTQRTVVRGLTSGTTYHFAIRAVDNAGNWSELSNLLKWDWHGDQAPPSAPNGVHGGKRGGRPLLSWAPNPEPDLAGYTVYRTLTEGGTYTRLNAGLLTVPEYEDATVPPGTENVWYEVTATDATGNESARSSAVSLSLVDETTAWAMEPGYPNPSRAGATVSIPLVAPVGGGHARLEIFNGAGQRVRLVDLGEVAPGSPVVQWDGRSDGGREVAPGVYTAWLIAGPKRLAIRLVRVP